MQEQIATLCGLYTSDITGFTRSGHQIRQSFKYGVCDSGSTPAQIIKRVFSGSYADNVSMYGYN